MFFALLQVYLLNYRHLQITTICKYLAKPSLAHTRGTCDRCSKLEEQSVGAKIRHWIAWERATTHGCKGEHHENCNEKPVQSQPHHACRLDGRRMDALLTDGVVNTDFLKSNLCKGNSTPGIARGFFLPQKSPAMPGSLKFDSGVLAIRPQQPPARSGDPPTQRRPSERCHRHGGRTSKYAGNHRGGRRSAGQAR